MRGLLQHCVAAAAAAGVMACGDPCGPRQEEILRADGSAYRCVLDTDCPRPAGVPVCTTDVMEAQCVRCVDSRCQRDIPGLCR